MNGRHSQVKKAWQKFADHRKQTTQQQQISEIN